MKHIATALFILLVSIPTMAQTGKTYSIFSYTAPAGFALKSSKDMLYYYSSAGKQYCQLFLYPAVNGQSDVEKDFQKNWDFFARKPEQGVGNPETRQKTTVNGWPAITATAKGSYGGQAFSIILTTCTKGAVTWYMAGVYSDARYLSAINAFTAAIQADEKKAMVTTPVQNNPANANTPATAGATGISKPTTNFDDGWVAKALASFVQLTKNGTEIRLHYIDDALDNARPNTIDAPEYYWSKYVTPFFNVSNPQKWAGVQYPVIYFMWGNAVNKQTGKTCFVAIKIVYSGGARPIVVIAPNESSYQQQFAHPNDLDRMLNYNKFAVTTADITGTWKGSGGGGVEYYNAYTGGYTGMSAISTSDEFVFNTNGTYTSTYRSANMNNGGAQFGGQDFKGKYTVTDWQVTATNRFRGKTTAFTAQLIAVRGGYLLYMSDPDNSSMNYTLFKTK